MAKNAPLNTAVLILASLLILAVGALAGERSIVSTDRVSPGDWTHDALMSLAADGLVPGMSARTFQGERRFTRLEMAGVVASVVRKAESESPNVRQSSLINHLVAEFGPELAEVAPDVASQWSGLSADLALPVDGKAFLLGYVRDLAVDQDPASPSPSDGTYRLSGFLNISDSMFAICTVAEHEDKVFHVLRTTNKYDKAFVRGQSGDVSWLVGRSYQNWSPAYTGSLILSDNGPALWQVRAGADLDFGKLIGEFQALQHRAAHLYTEIEITKAAVMKALQTLDADFDKAGAAVSVAKAKAGSTATLAAQEAVQMHGGVGMTDAFDIGFFMKRARVCQELFGDAAYHADQLARLKSY